MTPSISIYRYELVSRHQLNARAERSRFHGCLIRVGDGPFGYGCIHPWPELGDLDLGTIVEGLKHGKITPLAERALHCAAEDQAAREAGLSLFDKVDVPRSHATLDLNDDAFASAVDAGFDTVKVKLGRELNSEFSKVHELHQTYPNLRWRFDFNHTTSVENVTSLLEKLGDGVCGKIDFMEDAWLEGEVVPEAINDVLLAADRHVGQVDASHLIIKPAVNDSVPLMKYAQQAEKKVVFTSYMDHPLGQSYAAWQAGCYASKYPERVQTCGLVTHGLFQPTAFTDALGSVSPEFCPADGCGLGFDQLLGKLEWTPLI